MLTPKFSVLLSLYNGEKASNLRLSLESVSFSSTIMPDEIVLVIDGFIRDELKSVIDDFSDKFKSIKLIPLSENVGLASALNIGLNNCSNDLVFRMDTDDISLPERFEKQLNFMLENPQVSVLGSFVSEFGDDESNILSTRVVPTNHFEISSFILSRNPLSHPSVCFRKSHVLNVGGYPLIYPEDYLLWIKMLEAGYKFANLPIVLVKMRTGDDFIKRRGFKFLQGELKIYYYMYSKKMISIYSFFKFSILRSIVRLSPSFLKIWFYRNTRS